MVYKPEIIRLLIAHDSQDDAEQLINALRNAGRATRAELVLDEDSFLEALKSSHWELMLTRPSFGNCDLEQVMAHLQRLGKMLPVLVLGDELTTESLTQVLTLGARGLAPCSDRDLIMLQVDHLLDYVRLRRDRKQVELDLREAEKRLAVLMDQSRDAIAYVVDGMHIHANDTYLEMFGYSDVDDLAGMPIMDLVASTDHEALKQLLRNRAKDESKTHEMDFSGVKTDGEEFSARFTFSPSNYDGEACTQIVIRTKAVDEEALQEKLHEMSQVDQVTGLYNRGWFIDRIDDALGRILKDGGMKAMMYLRLEVDEEALQEKLHEMSQVDQVTGLYNRGWFIDRIDDALGRILKDGGMKALVYLRLDHFDQHQGVVGIDGGDEVLAIFAQHLRSILGEETAISRVGDEEFCILQEVSEPEQAATLAESLRNSVQQLMPAVKDRTLHLTASIGVAFVQEDSRNSQSVMTLALECCNRAEAANESKGNNVYVHDPLDDVEAGSEEAIGLILKKALEEDAFELQYQPIVKLDDENYAFFEVFVRLLQEDTDSLHPESFMPIAAKLGMVGKIDRWVILNALRAVASLPTKPSLLINLSGYSLQDATLVDWIAKALRASKYDGSKLTFQISEADANNFLKQAQAFVAKANKLGCKFSVGRFAGGINPLKMLEHLPVSLVKFDSSFSQELDKQESRDKFADLIAQVGEKGTEVLVSYVESAQQMQATWMLGGVDYLQGYYIQKPGPKPQFEAPEEE